MPVETLEGEDNGYAQHWVIGNTDYTFWNSDNDGTHIEENTGGLYHMMLNNTAKAKAAALINSVIVWERHAKKDAGTTNDRAVKEVIRINATNVLGNSSINNTTTPADYSFEFISARPGGGTWTGADFTNIEFGVYLVTNIGTGWHRCYHAWMVVDYTMGAGSFAHLLLQWLPPLLALASHSLMKSEIVEILSNLKLRPSNDEDFARILEAFRVRPKFLGPLALCASLPQGSLVALPGVP